MKRKITAIIVLSAMVLCSCAKTGAHVAEPTIEPATTQAESVAEAETAKPAETQAAPAEKTEPPLEKNSLLHLTGTQITEGKSVGGESNGIGIHVDYPEFELTEEDEDKFPQLAHALDVLNDSYEEEYENYLKESGEIAQEAVDDGTDMYMSFFDSLEPEIRRADSRIVSIFEYYSSYTGGVHGYYAFYGDNLDPKTGETIMLKDVITDMDSFKKTVEEKLYFNYPEVTFGDLESALEDIDHPEESGEIPWTMDYSGVTLYFNPYHLASYADGMQVITVPFNENPGMFKPEYADVPDTYVQQLNSGSPAYVDLNGDGINEAVFITEENETDFIVYGGDKEVVVSDGCYYADAYLVHANNQFYVYIFETSDNDYSLCTVVDLKKCENKSEKIFNARLASFDSEYEYTDDGYESEISYEMFTDPAEFTLESRVEVLGTNDGMKTYHVGRDGWPETDDEFFRVESSIVITAKKNLACLVVDKDGKEIKKENADKKGNKDTGKKADKNSGTNLTAGSQYILVRTDGETWADIQEVKADEFVKDPEWELMYLDTDAGLKADRAIYRIEYIGGSWPHKINGITEDKAFDGLQYAG